MERRSSILNEKFRKEFVKPKSPLFKSGNKWGSKKEALKRRNKNLGDLKYGSSKSKADLHL